MERLLLLTALLLAALPAEAQRKGVVDIANVATGDICLIQGIGASVMNGGNAYIAGQVPGHPGNPQPNHGSFGAGEITALEWHPDSSFNALEDPLANTWRSGENNNTAANVLTQVARLLYAQSDAAGEPCIPVVINSASGGSRIFPKPEDPGSSWDPDTGTLYQQSLNNLNSFFNEASTFFSGRTVYALGTVWWGGNDWYPVVNSEQNALAGNLAIVSMRLMERWYEDVNPIEADARFFWVPSASDIRVGAGTYQGRGDTSEYTQVEEDFCAALPGICILAAPKSEILDHVARYLDCTNDFCRESTYIINHPLLPNGYQPNHINYVNQLPLAEAIAPVLFDRFQALTP